MSGIVFFGTEDISLLKKFYTERIGARIWKDQGDCIIFRKGGFSFAFCEREKKPETCGIITFVFDSREIVNKVYSKLEDIAESEPESRVPDYNIYQFFGKDPEGRTLEFQCFLDEPE